MHNTYIKIVCFAFLVHLHTYIHTYAHMYVIPTKLYSSTQLRTYKHYIHYTQMNDTGNIIMHLYH